MGVTRLKSIYGITFTGYMFVLMEYDRMLIYVLLQFALFNILMTIQSIFDIYILG